MFKNKKKNHTQEIPRLVTVTKPKSVIAEQFKTIRTNIQYSMVDKELQTLTITSGAPNAGKSTIAANLAVTFANQGKKVLLVDADMRKPTVHKVFQLQNNTGLTNLLTEKEMTLDQAIQQAEIQNLFILTSGAVPPNPSELLDSKRMEVVTAELKEIFDLIIFDMPPVLAVTDAQIMAGKTDGTVFIVRKNTALKENMIKAKELLDNVHANVIGAVFNGIETEDGYYYYYHGEE